MISLTHEQDAKTEEKEDSKSEDQQKRTASKQIELAISLDNTPLLEKEVDLEEEKEDVISRPRASSNLSIQIFHKSTTTTAYTIHRSPRPVAFGHRRHANPLLSMHINQMLSLKRRYERWPGNNTFLCSGILMLGPHARQLLLSIALLTGTWCFAPLPSLESMFVGQSPPKKTYCLLQTSAGYQVKNDSNIAPSAVSSSIAELVIVNIAIIVLTSSIIIVRAIVGVESNQPVVRAVVAVVGFLWLGFIWLTISALLAFHLYLCAIKKTTFEYFKSRQQRDEMREEDREGNHGICQTFWLSLREQGSKIAVVVMRPNGFGCRTLMKIFLSSSSDGARGWSTRTEREVVATEGNQDSPWRSSFRQSRSCNCLNICLNGDNPSPDSPTGDVLSPAAGGAATRLLPMWQYECQDDLIQQDDILADVLRRMGALLSQRERMDNLLHV
eukprot:gene9795-10835_t